MSLRKPSTSSFTVHRDSSHAIPVCWSERGRIDGVGMSLFVQGTSREREGRRGEAHVRRSRFCVLSTDIWLVDAISGGGAMSRLRRRHVVFLCP